MTRISHLSKKINDAGKNSGYHANTEAHFNWDNPLNKLCFNGFLQLFLRISSKNSVESRKDSVFHTSTPEKDKKILLVSMLNTSKMRTHLSNT